MKSLAGASRPLKSPKDTETVSLDIPVHPESNLAVVVLAAGGGRRLASQGHAEPKWMLPVAGRRIADYQLDGLAQASRTGDRLVVVTGFNSTALSTWLGNRAPLAIPVELLHNDRWSSHNNWLSVLIAIERLDSVGWEGGLVVINSDLCAQPALYSRFLDGARRLAPGTATLAVDFHRPLSDEAMKVSGTVEADGQFRCSQIGKTNINRAAGEFLGMSSFAPSSWPLLIPVLRAFSAPHHSNEWYEAGFQQLMDRTGLFTAWATPIGNWVEVDDGPDWQRANESMRW